MSSPTTLPETINGNVSVAHFEAKPVFRVVKEIPPSMVPQVEEGVLDFMKTSHFPKGIDPQGFYHQTLEAIAQATYLGGGGEFWLGTIDGQVVIYILGHVGKDMDNRLTYHVSQAWVRKDYRRNPVVKEWWEAIRQRAKNLFCGHLVITSSRNYKAYERFLGHGMHLYATMLKEEL